MTVYLVGVLKVHRADWQAKYQQKLPSLVDRHGGRILAAGAPVVVEGEASAPDRLVLFSFPSVKAAQAWYDDPDHASLVELRQSGSNLNLWRIA